MNERRRSLQDRIRARQSDVFVGRTEQLRQFEENLDLPFDDPRQRFLFSVFGDAGIGKTFLVRQLARVAREKQWQTATVDHTVLGVPETMASIINQLEQAGVKVRRFTERYAAYQARRGELATDPDAPDGLSSLLTKSFVRVGLHAAGDVPVAGALTEAIDADAAAEQVDRLRRFLAGKFRNHDDLRLVISPISELTPAFIADIMQACERAPLALFFDTYERTSVFLDSWLMDLLHGRFGDLPENLILTVAGQHRLDPNRWAEFFGLRADIPLRVFTDEEARELLTTRGVTDGRVIEVILTLSGRLPVLLAMLAEGRPTTTDELGDPSGDAVERFLRWEEDETRRQAALLAALPRAVDADRVAAALDSDEVVAAATFSWLRSLPFVSVRAEGSHQYHDVVRDPMLRQLRREAPNTWRTAHLRLAEFHRARRAAMALADHDGALNDAWQADALEEIYHRLSAHEPAALTKAMHHLIDTWYWAEPDTTRRAAEAIAAAGREGAHPEAARRAAAILAPFSTVPTDPIALLTIFLQDTTCDAIHRARALTDRAKALYERGETVRAFADLTEAVERAPTLAYAWGSRGKFHRLADRFDAALTDLNRALELTPDYAWALASRGQTYQALQRYDEALTDFNRALELTPDDAWLLDSRAETYQALQRYDEALTDLNRALELKPDYAWALGSRGQTYQALQRYDEALTDLNRALELEPDATWLLDSRAETYQALQRYDEALTDLDRSVETDDQDGWTHYFIGLVRHAMGASDNAEAAITRALAVDLESLEADPGNARLSFNVAVYLRALDREEEAEARVLATLATDPVPPALACIDDLKQLQRTTGKDVTRLLALLERPPIS
ncbi:tetratricopeptide repeat protein [Frankia sp. AgPm24]|uniref:tetratricopeptide repeat protein n=1 Tax=Frankia sp. AgPm24 TaxID=631128 RepID=UPI00200FB7A1|nr:tetratricopeptide repeat protein [Frankia sp. AgPm24]MCK9920361.1 tetratricopeptide repeat protein [Frankia sp. AgPm24]